MFEGVLPAIITPFKRNSAINLDVSGLERNIAYLLSCGIHGIVPCGSTGESATLSFAEHEKVVSVTIDKINGKVPDLPARAQTIRRKQSYSRRRQRTPAQMACSLSARITTSPTAQDW